MEKKIETITVQFRVIEDERRHILDTDGRIEEYRNVNNTLEKCSNPNESNAKSSNTLESETCGKTGKQFEQQLAEALSVQLEKVKENKETIKKQDDAADVEHKQLLKEAQTLGEEKQALIKRNTEIDKENEKLKRYFLQIFDDRNTMIENNELLNAQYQVTQQNMDGKEGAQN